MPEGTDVAVELERLRGTMNTGFAKIEGQLSHLVLSDARRQSDLDSLETRVAALEARRMPLGVLAVMSGTVSAVVAAGAFLVQM